MRMQARIRFTRPSRSTTLKIRCDAYSRVASLRKELARPGLLLGPGCHDGISAKLIEQAGFSYTFMSGFTTSASKLGAPDVGLLTYSEMVERGRDVHEATQYIPVIGDGDTGYGNPMNVKRTVRGYADAGFAGILIEDQEWPKSCGHVKSKRVVSRKESVQRIAAAIEARDMAKDIAILARTDARQAESLDEALYRIQAFADAGADILFIDALETIEEMEKFCRLCPSVPKLANMLEGGGKTPILTPDQLESIGFKLAAYPLSLMGVSINAMQQALKGLREGRIPDLDFRELQEILGFDAYFAERDGYVQKAERIMERSVVSSVSPNVGLSEETTSDTPQKRNGTTAPATLEADAVLTAEEEEASQTGVTVAVETLSEDRQEEKSKDKWFPSFARIRVTNTRNQETKMEFKIPVGFLNDVSKFIPSLKDTDLLSFVTRERFPDGEPVFHFTDDDDHVEIFLD